MRAVESLKEQITRADGTRAPSVIIQSHSRLYPNYRCAHFDTIQRKPEEIECSER